jgi:hypothetical protein|tara:strand:+ start:76 stop:321 length:246 start_codon:yes stop_codon:yes gene_type:complete
MVRTIQYAGENWNKDYIKSISEYEFVSTLKHKYDQDTLTKLWKIVHGKSVPNYEVKESKPKRKRIKEESKAKNKAEDESKF